jgi:hypothetical protein
MRALQNSEFAYYPGIAFHETSFACYDIWRLPTATRFLFPQTTHNNMADTRDWGGDRTPVTRNSGLKMISGKQILKKYANFATLLFLYSVQR